MIEVFYSFSILFITCELDQRINLAFVECSQMVEQLDWYLFPMNIQRMLPMILHFTQQPFEIICFGSKACNRDTFKSVGVRHIHLQVMNEIQVQIQFFPINILLGGQHSILLLYGSS